MTRRNGTPLPGKLAQDSFKAAIRAAAFSLATAS